MNKEILVVPVSDETEFKVVKNQGFYRLRAGNGVLEPIAILPTWQCTEGPLHAGRSYCSGQESENRQRQGAGFGRYRRQFTHFMRGEHNYERKFYKLEIGPLIRLTKPVMNRTSQPFRNPRYDVRETSQCEVSGRPHVTLAH